MRNYSPFDCDISEIQPENLVRLKTVQEGWYVEYKAEEVNASAYAKAISAFANTYGGWLFVGIAEHSKENPVAGSFPGISAKTADACLQRIRESAAMHLHPPPHFETKILNGPNKDLDMQEDNAIICVYIPQSNTAPHIHKDGRVYRRVSDSSAPKPENDRHAIDQLFMRGKKVEEIIDRWVTKDPEFSELEAETPYLRLLFAVDPWMQMDPWVELSLKEVRDMMATAEPHVPSITFDSVYPNAIGFVARQVMQNDPEKYGLTLSFGRDLSGELVVPLTDYRAQNSEALAKLFSHYEYGQKYLDLLDEQNFNRVKILDLNLLMGILLGFTMKYRTLLRTAGEQTQFYTKVKILNIARHTPFIDIGSVMNDFDKHGIPVCLQRELTCPPGRSPQSFLHIPHISSQNLEWSEAVDAVSQAIKIFLLVQNALGVSFLSLADDEAPLWPDLQKALKNAQKVQSESGKFRS